MAAAGSVGRPGIGLAALLCASLCVACGDDDMPAPVHPDGSMGKPSMQRPRDDGGTASGDATDAGATTSAGSGGKGGGSAPGFDAGAIPTIPASGSVCTLGVGATCDGPEDCPVPQSCCAVFDATRLTYASIGCALNCDAPNEFELCHPKQGCSGRNRVCRRSAVVPHDFITVCVTPSPLVRVPAESTSEAIDERVICGADQCAAGTEQCCLRSEFDFATRMSVALEPYCAPAGSACSCDTQPPSISDDQDGGMIPG